MTEQRAIPMLAYEDAGRAAEWITKVFGFRETERFHDGVGTVTDVVLDLDGAEVLVGHPSDAYQGPRRHAQACALARQWLETPYIVDGVVVYVDDIVALSCRAYGVSDRAVGLFVSEGTTVFRDIAVHEAG